jgi:hypothetical protein
MNREYEVAFVLRGNIDIVTEKIQEFLKKLHADGVIEEEVGCVCFLDTELDAEMEAEDA